MDERVEREKGFQSLIQRGKRRNKRKKKREKENLEYKE